MQGLGEHRKVVRGAFDYRCGFFSCSDNTPTNSNSNSKNILLLPIYAILVIHTSIFQVQCHTYIMHTCQATSDISESPIECPEQVGRGFWIGNPHLHHNTATPLLHLIKVLTLHSIAVIQIIKQISGYHLYSSILGMVAIAYFVSWRTRHSSRHWEILDIRPKLILNSNLAKFLFVYNIRSYNPLQYHCRDVYKMSRRLDDWNKCYGRTRVREIWV